MTRFSIILLSTALLSGAAHANTPLPDTLPSIVSGGVGLESQQEILAIQRSYSTKLVFTQNNGAYLAGVQVHITDKKGRIHVDTVTEGPFLLVQLAPGTYTVEATADGIVKKRTISVGNSLKTFGMQFPIEDDAELSFYTQPAYNSTPARHIAF